VGTAAHFAVLVALVEGFDSAPVVASSAGFVVGAVVNYLLNRRYTFRTAHGHLYAFPRFMGVSVLGMLLNGVVMALMLHVSAINYVASQVFATGLVLLWNFSANRWWTFRARLPAGAPR
jgi:putative flippase GtrA